MPMENLAFDKIQLCIIAYRLPHNEIHNLQLDALLSLHCFASYLFSLWMQFESFEASAYISALTYLFVFSAAHFHPNAHAMLYSDCPLQSAEL